MLEKFLKDLKIKYKKSKRGLYLPEKDARLIIVKTKKVLLPKEICLKKMSILHILFFLQWWQDLNWPKDQNRSAEDIAKDFVLCANGELAELLNCFPWKRHTKYKNFDTIRPAILEEIIDIFKYLLSFIIKMHFTPEEIIEEFMRKTEVVEQKFKQERLLSMQRKIAVIDIDGIIADYPKSFVNFIHEKTGYCYDVSQLNDLNIYEQIGKVIGMKKILQLKHEYRINGYKRDIPLVPGIKRFMREIHKQYSILLMTARPFKEYKRMYADTLYFLRKNNIPFDIIVWDEKKGEKIIKEFPNVSFVLDDSLQTVNAISRMCFDRKIKIFLLNRGYNQGKIDKGIERVNSFSEILEKVK